MFKKYVGFHISIANILTLIEMRAVDKHSWCQVPHSITYRLRARDAVSDLCANTSSSCGGVIFTYVLGYCRQTKPFFSILLIPFTKSRSCLSSWFDLLRWRNPGKG